jgi:hypothetical protein
MSMAGNFATHEKILDIPGSAQKVKVQVELVPVKSAPAILADQANVSKVTVGGEEFFALVGKTATI